MNTKRLLLFASLALAALVATPASAALQFSADINGSVFSCVDNAACDTNPAVGQIGIADQTINGVEIAGSSQFQIIGASNAINSSSFQIINHNLTAATIQIAISGINFLGPVTNFAASGSGTWQNAIGSAIALSYFGSAANQQGANNPTDLPGLLLAMFGHTAVNPADAFSFNQSGAFLAGGLFGMSLGTSGTLVGWDGVAGEEPTLVGRSQTLLAQEVVQQTPEPASLALLGIGLAAFGFAGVRRKS
jgi:hypothetical protein